MDSGKDRDKYGKADAFFKIQRGADGLGQKGSGMEETPTVFREGVVIQKRTEE